MKKSGLLAGIGAIVLAATAAVAADNNVHEMTVRLPGGGVEHITYTGDVAPKVVVQPSGAAVMPQVGFMPMAFPDMARIQADMQRQMAQMHAMIQHANAMAAQAFANAQNGAISIAAGGLPVGGHFCARSVQITTGADGKQNVVTHTAGDCGGAAQTGAPANHPSAAKGSTI